MYTHLTRTWRPKTFSEVVGQRLSVRLLQNSLFRDEFFPAYLFSGLRGSGKTTTARLFAASLNCAARERFQRDPHSVDLPCGLCDSCVAMNQGSHPDFFEVDAASYTGVDNVRSIIEAASFLPSLGTRKVYLIDEAHMLSKAACNAFLKILEEPPATALFLLATTEPHKIIETVTSRSFQLFFDPLSHEDITGYIRRICTEEKIDYDEAGLAVVAQESQGSARDAVNIVERVRLAAASVTAENVYHVLGLLYDSTIITLFETIIAGDVGRLVAFLQEKRLAEVSPRALWDMLLRYVRAFMWMYYGQDPTLIHADRDDVRSIANALSVGDIMHFLESMYRVEAHFLKTAAQYALIESMLCKWCVRFSSRVRTDAGSSLSYSAEEPSTENTPSQEGSTVHADGAEDESRSSVASSAQQKASVESVRGDADVREDARSKENVPSGDDNTPWRQFLEQLAVHGLQMAHSLFAQGIFREEADAYVVAFDKGCAFYKSWLDENKSDWHPYFSHVYGEQKPVEIRLEASVVSQSAASEKNGAQQKERALKNVSSHKEARTTRSQSSGNSGGSSRGSAARTRTAHVEIDVSDSAKWPIAAMVRTTFSGRIVTYKG